VLPVVALCFHRPSVAELTVSMAELFAVVEGIGDRIMLRYYLSPLPAHAALLQPRYVAPYSMRSSGIGRLPSESSGVLFNLSHGRQRNREVTSYQRSPPFSLGARR
jgi:hypothetical protein